jgi:hypothetical protein
MSTEGGLDNLYMALPKSTTCCACGVWKSEKENYDSQANQADRQDRFRAIDI